MKYIVLVLFFTLNVQAGVNEFIMTVQSDNTGPSSDSQFTIPTFGSGYNYNVDCNNDGTFEGTAITGDYTCDFTPFGGAGTYQTRIRGNLAGFGGFPRIYFNNSGDKLKVLSIDQWGTNPWKNMRAAFRGASNMTVTATDVPNLSQVENTSLMFSAANMANPDTSMWDTSNITNMAAMFQNATSATPDVINWDVSMVSNMGFMFAGATSANPNLSHWDIGSATDMTNMLGGSAISTINYDTMLVNFNSMLPTPPTVINLGNVPTTRCSQAGQDAYTNLTIIYSWTINDQGICTAANPVNDFVIEVDTNIAGSTSNTQFEINTNNSNGEVYNYNVDCDTDNPGVNIATAQVGNYICTYTNPGIYTIAISDNLGDRTGFPRIYYNFLINDRRKIINLKQWGTGKWTSMKSAFSLTTNMQVTAIDVPDLSNLTSMASMFSGASSANPDVSGWNTSNVTDMSFLFAGASSANPNVSGWNTANVTDMSAMFNDAISANPDVSSWNTTNINDMSFLFARASTANPDVSSWNTTNVTNMSVMFAGATSANPNVSGWNTINVTNMSSMFSGATSANPDVSSWNIGNITNMANMFDFVRLPINDYEVMLNQFNSQSVQNNVNFSGGFSQYCSAASIAAHNNLQNNHGWIIDDGGVVGACFNPENDFVFVIDTNKIGSTSNTEFNIETSPFTPTYNYNVDCDDDNPGINTISGKINDYTCSYSVPGIYTIRISDNNGDKTGFPHFYNSSNHEVKKIIELKQWGDGIWKSMRNSFSNATNMIVSATDIPDLSQVNSMITMFRDAPLANPDTSGWDTSNITNMISMFQGASSAIPDTSNWNTAQVTNMSSMFQGATSANPNVSSWDIGMVEEMTDMFTGVTLPTSDYDAMLNHFSSQLAMNNVPFSGGNSKYCAVAAHDNLQNNFMWTITDGGLDTNCPTTVENIFNNGFENVIVFKAVQSQFNYDFSEVSITEMDEQPLLIAEGIDANLIPIIRVYLRNDLGQMQIRLDKLIEIDGENNQWIEGQWQSIDNKELTTISW